MIRTVIRVGWLRLRHDKVELLVAFVVPIAFFTIFAFIFEGQIGLGKSPRVEVALVDEDRTELSAALLETLAGQTALRVYSPSPDRASGPAALDAAAVEELVRSGVLPLAVIVPPGWTGSATSRSESPVEIRILADASDPVATQVVSALIQRIGNETLAERAQRDIQALFLVGESMRQRGGLPSELASLAMASFPEPVGIEVVDLFSAGKANPAVSMYAAGIAVMFLLFSAVGNAGSLLDEQENQTLERLMCSELSMTQLLAGKWLLLTFVGIAQVTVMLVWAQVAFGVDLTGHLAGFAVMTLVTSGSASSLALTLAAACRSRTQLNAVAIVLILCMSALGGSMVPRYVMSASMQEIGRVTFNAWALDGYMKVFWRDLPVSALAPEVAVLTALSVGLFGAARVLARRWEQF